MIRKVPAAPEKLCFLRGIHPNVERGDMICRGVCSGAYIVRPTKTPTWISYGVQNELISCPFITEPTMLALHLYDLKIIQLCCFLLHCSYPSAINVSLSMYWWRQCFSNVWNVIVFLGFQLLSKAFPHFDVELTWIIKSIQKYKKMIIGRSFWKTCIFSKKF